MSSRLLNIPSLLLLLFALTVFPSFAQDDIPAKPSPPRLVNDLAGILDASAIESLENKLVAFNDSTSTQITVVIVPSIAGYDPSDFAQRIGQKWGVGGQKFNNGFVILVKPKTAAEKGEAFIATGYGVEPFVPDATAWDIVNNEMIPRFRENDYAGGIDAAVNTLMKFTSGEFTASNYKKKKKGDSGGGGIVIAIILFVILFTIFTRGKGNRNIGRRSSGSMLWPFLFGVGSGSNWGNFSGGSGGFGGGGGGGFGGFGGGSFGGGGAGGSW